MIPPKLYYVAFTYKAGDRRRNHRVSQVFQSLRAANNWRPTAAYVYQGSFERRVYECNRH